MLVPVFDSFESVEEQLNSVREKAIYVEANCTEAAGRSKRLLAPLWEECDLYRPRMTTAKSTATILHKRPEVVAAKIGN